jgi:hypothetical protein
MLLCSETPKTKKVKKQKKEVMKFVEKESHDDLCGGGATAQPLTDEEFTELVRIRQEEQERQLQFFLSSVCNSFNQEAKDIDPLGR